MAPIRLAASFSIGGTRGTRSERRDNQRISSLESLVSTSLALLCFLHSVLFSRQSLLPLTILKVFFSNRYSQALSLKQRAGVQVCGFTRGGQRERFFLRLSVAKRRLVAVSGSLELELVLLTSAVVCVFYPIICLRPHRQCLSSLSFFRGDFPQQRTTRLSRPFESNMHRISSSLVSLLLLVIHWRGVVANVATYASAVHHGGVLPRQSSSTTSASLEDHFPLVHSQSTMTTPTITARRYTNNYNNYNDRQVVNCISAGAVRTPGLASTLFRGALLRVTSDLVGGTAFENVKTRVTTTRENMPTAAANIVRTGGWKGLYSGGSSRFVEGALVGAVFMLGSSLTKRQLTVMGCPPTMTALCAGLVGGVAQGLIMTPAGMIFTTLNVERSNGNHDETPWSVTKRIVQDRGGWMGMYSGFKPMAIRQATNWASRSAFTEMARSVLGLQRFGLVGELGSGILGGVGSCWNTPIETVRVLTQRDLSMGTPTKTITGYWEEIYQRDGPTGLFRGVSPRILQAVWQTCFLVVVPNLMGI